LTISSPADSSFQVDRLPHVNEQLRTLAKRAARLDIHELYVAALKKAVQQLKTTPLSWGNPAYRTRHQGGVVCHVIVSPLVLHYVVFELEQVVSS
jgi:hypothetical protein